MDCDKDKKDGIKKELFWRQKYWIMKGFIGKRNKLELNAKWNGKALVSVSYCYQTAPKLSVLKL